MKNIQTILKEIFWLEAFREGQQEIIEHIIEGNDTLVFMPTGGGKSLTYQLPALMREGIAIVISPLISLMKDQVDKLKELGIRTEVINSTLSTREKQDILHELKYFQDEGSEGIKFLYIAPERLNSNEFIGILKTCKISLLAIDEAHCISQWGHDFRPSYMKILSFIEELAGWKTARYFPVVGLTATATPKVREDIVGRLGLTKYKSFISGFDRKNICIIVREISAKEEKQKKVEEIIEKTPWIGIIYCSSRKHVIELSDYLISRGIKTGVYKGDLSAEVRDREQNAFMNDQYKVMVATNAFGMGIDKKDVRFVIHYNLPGSIENYYQEIGRAGRDGKMSYAVTLASYGDTKIQEFFIENTYPEKKEILDFYDYLYQKMKLGEGKAERVAKTYVSMASESGVGNDMKVAAIIKILEKYGILRRWLEETDTESDFRGRWLTLLQEKRQHSHVMIDWKRQDLLKEESYHKLEEMKKLLFYPRCRKRYILEYFGDKEDLAHLPQNCGVCDYCLESKKYSTEDIEKMFPLSSYSLILESVKKYDEKFGQVLLVRMLLWSGDKRLEEWHLDDYEHFWALKEYDKETIGAMFDALITENFLFKTSGQYPCIGITELGRAAIFRSQVLKNVHSDMNHFVLQKAGNTKKTSGKSDGKRAASKKSETYKETLNLWKQGKNLQEISKTREISLQTIEQHIIHLYESGELSLFEILKLSELEKLKTVKLLVESDALIDNLALKPIKEILQDEGRSDISYFDIKLALALIEKEDL